MPPHAALPPDQPQLPKVPRNLDSANSPHPNPSPARTSAPPRVKLGVRPTEPRTLQEPWPAKVKTEPAKPKTEPAKPGNAPVQAPSQQKPWPVNQREPCKVNQRKPCPVKAGNAPTQAPNQRKPWPANRRNQRQPWLVKRRNHKEPGPVNGKPGPVKAGKGPVGAGNRTRGGPGGRPPDGIAVQGAGCQRQPSMMSQLVGEEGFEPSRPRGHTDLNRARLPFRHPPRATSQVSTTSCLPPPPIRSDASRGRRYPGGSATALRATARRHG
jgi:hypothetical protein